MIPEKLIWPTALVLCVIAICLAASSIVQANREGDARVACARSGGTVGSHFGKPTCTR